MTMADKGTNLNAAKRGRGRERVRVVKKVGCVPIWIFSSSLLKKTPEHLAPKSRW